MNKNILLIIFVILISLIVTGSAFSSTINRSKVIILTLKNEADIEKSKNEVLKIPHVKKISITYRDKEWSKYVNKYDLPKMENPFKNELIVKVDKKINLEEVFNEVQKKDFSEKVRYDLDKTLMQKITFWK